MGDYLTVKSNLPAGKDGGTPVALWEKDDAHPGEEVFISGPNPVKVAKTAGVLGALKDERIVEVQDAKADPPTAPKPDDVKPGK